MPEGNHFPTGPDLDGLVTGAGFTTVARVAAADLPAAPPIWQERIERVKHAVAALHVGDQRQDVVRDQEAILHRLLASGAVTGRLLAVR